MAQASRGLVIDQESNSHPDTCCYQAIALRTPVNERNGDVTPTINGLGVPSWKLCLYLIEMAGGFDDSKADGENRAGS